MQQSESFYRSIMEKIIYGYIYCRIITDENNHPADFEFIEANQAFLKMTGFNSGDVIGKKVTEVMASVIHSNFEWITLCINATFSGNSAVSEEYCIFADRRYLVSVYSPEPQKFIAIFKDEIQYNEFAEKDKLVYELEQQEKKAEKNLQRAYERRRKNDLLNDIICGKTTQNPELIGQAYRQGINLSIPLSCHLITIIKNEGQSLKKWQEQPEQLHILIDGIIDMFTGDESVIAWEYCQGIVMLYAVPPDCDDIKQYEIQAAHAVIKIIKEQFPHIEVVIGIGEFQPVVDIARSYQQASDVVAIGQSIWPEREVHHYLDMGIFQLLAKFTDKAEVDAFIERSIGKLIAYDKEKSTDLVATLEAILINDNLKATAEKMFFHYKTVVFRKQRIEKILDVSLENFECKLTLGSALKLYRLRQ